MSATISWSRLFPPQDVCEGFCNLGSYELYKTQTLVTLSANAYMGVTSNNPIFTTEGGGLPDRIITARVCSGWRSPMPQAAASSSVP